MFGVPITADRVVPTTYAVVLTGIWELIPPIFLTVRGMYKREISREMRLVT